MLVLLKGGSVRVCEIWDAHHKVFLSQNLHDRLSGLGVCIPSEQHPALPLSLDSSNSRPYLATDDLRVEGPGLCLLIVLGCYLWLQLALHYGICAEIGILPNPLKIQMMHDPTDNIVGLACPQCRLQEYHGALRIPASLYCPAEFLYQTLQKPPTYCPPRGTVP